jgi:hypothetical protein
VAGLARASGQTRIGHLLVFTDKVLYHALLAGDLAKGGEVDVAELLDVQRAAILWKFVSILQTVCICGTYLIGLVVVLRVVLENLRLLLVVECANKLLDADASVCGPPLLAVDEPISMSAPPPFPRLPRELTSASPTRH